MNLIAYADDMVLLALSIKAPQDLVDMFLSLVMKTISYIMKVKLSACILAAFT